MGLTSGSFPAKGLRYPKPDEKPPFKTWGEIEREIAGSGEPEELWECLYLALPEVGELLAYVRGHATQPFVYPMVAFAAHTGARRSEMLRALVTDVDFPGNTVLIREKMAWEPLDELPPEAHVILRSDRRVTAQIEDLRALLDRRMARLTTLRSMHGRDVAPSEA